MCGLLDDRHTQTYELRVRNAANATNAGVRHEGQGRLARLEQCQMAVGGEMGARMGLACIPAPGLDAI